MRCPSCTSPRRCSSTMPTAAGATTNDRCSAGRSTSPVRASRRRTRRSMRLCGRDSLPAVRGRWCSRGVAGAAPVRTTCRSNRRHAVSPSRATCATACSPDFMCHPRTSAAWDGCSRRGARHWRSSRCSRAGVRRASMRAARRRWSRRSATVVRRRRNSCSGAAIARRTAPRARSTTSRVTAIRRALRTAPSRSARR